MANCETLNVYDLCAGISAFSSAAKRIPNSPFNFVGSFEVDNYCNTYLKENGHELGGDLNYFAINEDNHPLSELADQDKVPVEETGFTTFTIEEMLNDVIPFPDVLILTFPCQTTSRANTTDNRGIQGGPSQLIDDILVKVENTMPKYLIGENAQDLVCSGLYEICLNLMELGYQVEFETISGANFGYNQYRHRTFFIAYLPETKAYKSGRRLFDIVTSFANKKPGDVFPLFENQSKELLDLVCLENPKGGYRRHRVAALGNSIILDICYSILVAIKTIEELSLDGSMFQISFDFSNDVVDRIREFKFNVKKNCKVLPSRGLASDGAFYTGPINRILNPSNKEFKGMSASLIRNDYKNTFATKSRLNRPGTLGGLTGFIMSNTNHRIGALNPVYCELSMGFDLDSTKLKSTKLLKCPF
ncbi:hypothetical protein F7Q91_02880 [Vibrio chagasii]|uniref:DNA (cytosine-5-)-methyltransferase n=1 Tax=Vibrio chagasii TaxID=170679 RepID=A0A7V7NWY1_9VIBR|nr:DNA cytosine methyltransferase [Vibrio chagasii]KAB0482365.1 hypothetical protein F7Q91_02880 [Vibrio chagasii]